LTDGEYEHVDLIDAGIDSALSERGYEIVDVVPEGQSTQSAARFRIVSTVKLVGARKLEFFGRTETLQTVIVTAQATDLATGKRAAGPFSTSVDYTSINLEEKLRQGANEIGTKLAAALEGRLASGR
jgi:hypothetical protein